MATKESVFGIKVKINGKNEVVRTIGEIEEALLTLNNNIKDTDIGTKQFEDAQKEIRKLKGLLISLDKDLEGIDVEKRFQGIGAAIGFTTSSFQALSGVMGLVSTDTETLAQVQAAEAKALNVINIAMGINNAIIQLNDARQKGLIGTIKKLSLTTIKDTITKTANSIATGIQTAATTALTAAQTALNAAMAANPIGAVIAGIVALGAAIYGLVKVYQNFFTAQGKQEKQTRELLKLEKEFTATKLKAGKTEKEQLKILTDNIKTRNLEKKTIDDLKKTYPGFNAFVNSNNTLNEKGIAFLKTKIKLLQAEAVLQAIAEKKAEAEIKLSEDLTDLQINGVGVFQQITSSLLGRNAALDAALDLAKDYSDATKGLTMLEEQYLKVIDEAQGELSGYNKILEAQAKREEDAAKAADRVALALQKRNALIQQYIKDLKELTAIELKYTADVLEKQADVLKRQEQLIDERTNKLKSKSATFREELGRLLFDTIPTPEEVEMLADNYSNIFNDIGDKIASGIIGVDTRLTTKNIFKYLDETLRSSYENLSDESKAALLDFFNNVKSRVDAVEKINNEYNLGLGDRAEITQMLSDSEDYLYSLQKARLRLGYTENQINKEKLSYLSDTFGLTTKIEDTQRLITAEESSKKKGYEQRVAALKEQLKTLQEFVQTLYEDNEVGLEFFGGIAKVQEKANENQKELNENVAELKRQFTEEEINGLFTFLAENIEYVDVLVEDLIKNIDKYSAKVGYENTGQIFEVLQKALKETDKLSRKTLENLKTQLEDALNQEGILEENRVYIEAFLNDVNKQLKKLPTEAEEAFMKTAENVELFLSKWLGQLDALANRYYKILQTRSSTYLEQLQRDEEATLASIGTANDRALQLQEEARKEFAKKRFEAEKKARIQELRFSLAQTISSEAQAIANIFATTPPPASFALAGLVGALVAGQVLAVRNQLTSVKSQQFIGRRGGMITGQSHEGSMGGVPALLEGGEFVVNKAAVAQYGDLIGELNSSTGGRRLAIDDSRIVQTIASQNQNTPPLKAYVLYNDIQSTNKLNSRITQLAKL